MAGYNARRRVPNRQDRSPKGLKRKEFRLTCTQFNRSWRSACFSDGAKEIWLPRSEIWIRDNIGGVETPRTGGEYTVSVPVWLAEAEGLI